MIRTNQSHLFVAAISRPGLAAKHNQDNFAVSSYITSAKNPIPSLFAIVSDGFGGHQAEPSASLLAVNLISATIEKREGGNPINVLENAFVEANKTILPNTAGTPGQVTGASAACAWIIGECLYTAHIGDSRIYLARNQTIQQLSHDHTWLQEAVDKNAGFKHSGLSLHENLHIPRRYLGSEDHARPDFRLFLLPGQSDELAIKNQGCLLSSRDVILLCTDGLSDFVQEQDIQEILDSQQSLQNQAGALFNLAKSRGSQDNITAILLKMP